MNFGQQFEIGTRSPTPLSAICWSSLSALKSMPKLVKTVFSYNILAKCSGRYHLFCNLTGQELVESQLKYQTWRFYKKYLIWILNSDSLGFLTILNLILSCWLWINFYLSFIKKKTTKNTQKTPLILLFSNYHWFVFIGSVNEKIVFGNLGLTSSYQNCTKTTM